MDIEEIHMLDEIFKTLEVVFIGFVGVFAELGKLNVEVVSFNFIFRDGLETIFENFPEGQTIGSFDGISGDEGGIE